MHRKRARRILGDFEKSRLSWVLPRKKTVDFRLLAEALWRVRTWWAADRRVSRERLCLSSCVEKPFNSKVIKSFVPELRSRKCFSCFGILMFCVLYIYIYIWTLYVRFTYSCMGLLQKMSNQTNYSSFSFSRI